MQSRCETPVWNMPCRFGGHALLVALGARDAVGALFALAHARLAQLRHRRPPRPPAPAPRSVAVSTKVSTAVHPVHLHAESRLLVCVAGNPISFASPHVLRAAWGARVAKLTKSRKKPTAAVHVRPFDPPARRRRHLAREVRPFLAREDGDRADGDGVVAVVAEPLHRPAPLRLALPHVEKGRGARRGGRGRQRLDGLLQARHLACGARVRA